MVGGWGRVLCRQEGLPERRVVWRLLGSHGMIRKGAIPISRPLPTSWSVPGPWPSGTWRSSGTWRRPRSPATLTGGATFTAAPALPPLHLTEGEAVAVFLAEKLMRPCRAPFEKEVSGTLQKLVALLPEEVTVGAALTSDWTGFNVEPLRGGEYRVAAGAEVLVPRPPRLSRTELRQAYRRYNDQPGLPLPTDPVAIGKEMN